MSEERSGANFCSHEVHHQICCFECAEARLKTVEDERDDLREIVGEVIGYMSNNPRSWAERWVECARAALSDPGQEEGE